MPSLTVVVDGQGSFPIDLDPESATLAQLKTWLSQNREIPIEHQIVKFMGGVIQGDDQNLISFGIQEGSHLHVEDARNDLLPVTLERLDGSDSISVTMSRRLDTIGSLKRKIEEVELIPVIKQVIRRDGVGCTDASYLSRFFRDGVVDLQLEVRIDVRLNVYTGESFVTNVASHELVSTLQQRVQQRLRIPSYHQEPVYNEQVMDSSSRINEFGVTDGSTIEIRLRLYEMTIFLKTLLGQTIVITVTSHDTVLDVKRKVELKEGIPVDRQRIVFTGIQLHNHERFLSYRIEHESAVHIVLRCGDSYEIAVITPTGRMRSVEVAPKEIVGYIKRKMLELEGIAIDIQRLYFNDQLLDNDDATMEDCGIVGDSHIFLRIDSNRNTQIFVSFRDRRTVTLWVDPDYTIARLKEIISSRESLPIDDIDIFFTRVKLEDDRTLRSYVIESNHMLHVEIVSPPVLQLTINVQNNSSGDLRLEEPDNMTIEGVKRAIFSKRGFAVGHQQLFFRGHELEDQQRLRDCEVTSGSKLDLILSSNTLSDPTSTAMHIFVKTLTGKTITLETQLSDTVGSLKQQIFEKEGMDIDSQCLVLSGRQMENSETVASIGVQNQSVIHLVMRVPSTSGAEIVIQDLDSSFTVSADLQGSVGDLKRRIERQQNIPVANQRLLFQTRVLGDEETLSSQDITDGATLQLMRH